MGTGKTLTPAGLVNDGFGGADYSYNFTSVSTGEIDALSITVTAAADTKTYDGTKSSTKTPTLSLTLPLVDSAAFTQSFDTKDVGTGKTLTPAGLVNDGFGGNDYAYAFAPVTSGTITALAITVTAVADTKTYDGTKSSTEDPDAEPDVAARRQRRVHAELRHKRCRHKQDFNAYAAGLVNDGNGGNDYVYIVHAGHKWYDHRAGDHGDGGR